MMASSIGFSITSSFEGGNIEVVSQGEPVISGRTAKLTVNVSVKPGEKIMFISCVIFFMLSTIYNCNGHSISYAIVAIILVSHVNFIHLQ